MLTKRFAPEDAFSSTGSRVGNSTDKWIVTRYAPSVSRSTVSTRRTVDRVGLCKPCASRAASTLIGAMAIYVVLLRRTRSAHGSREDASYRSDQRQLRIPAQCIGIHHFSS